MQVIRQVTLFIEQYGMSRFQPLHTEINPLIESGTYPNRAGFREVKSNTIRYYVLPESFAEICRGVEPQRAAQVLRDAGILLPESKDRLQAKPPRDLPGWGRKRVYVLSFDATEEAVETI